MFRGVSYGELAAQWWSTIFAIPIVDGQHPYLSGGAFGEYKGVTFLAAAFGEETVEIEVTVAPGTALFLPVINAECSVFEPDPFHGDNEAELRECANGHIDQTSGLVATIDGVPVGDLDAYRGDSPLFEFTLPENNVLGAPGGTTTQAVDAGVYLLLAPLSPGLHTIHVEATFDEFGASINTTFHVTVE
jgi:hypothetical protein